MRVCLAVLMAFALLPATCDVRRGHVESRPGETSEEFRAASRVLTAVAEGTPLIEVRLLAAEGGEQRRTVGAVVDTGGRIIVDASAISLAVGDGTAHTRTIEAVFHPGGDVERRVTARVLRESEDTGLALLAVEDAEMTALPLGEDLAGGTPAFLIATPLNVARLAVEPGEVLEYADTENGRSVVHSAVAQGGPTGPLVDSKGELVGLQVARGDADRQTIPAAEIARWLRQVPEDERPPSEPGQVVDRLLRQMDVDSRPASSGEGFIVVQDDADVLVRQVQNTIAVQVDLGALDVGAAVEALRVNYSDPVGAVALRPVGNEEQLVWVSRLPTADTTADYLHYVITMAFAQFERWSQLQAGLEPPDPYDLYPGGDESAQGMRLLEMIQESSLEYESSGNGWKLEPDSAVPIYVNLFRGMAYFYAFSGGMPGEGESEQDRVARELLRRNWELRLGRLSLDTYQDLAWEAQVPMEYLTPGLVAALTRAGAAEVAALRTLYGNIPFNEQ